MLMVSIVTVCRIWCMHNLYNRKKIEFEKQSIANIFNRNDLSSITWGRCYIRIWLWNLYLLMWYCCELIAISVCNWYNLLLMIVWHCNGCWWIRLVWLMCICQLVGLIKWLRCNGNLFLKSMKSFSFFFHVIYSIGTIYEWRHWDFKFTEVFEFMTKRWV